MIRVLLADDHHIVRLGLKAVLELEPDIQVVGQAASAQAAITTCEEHRPDVILLDLRMPGCGHSAIPEIVSRAPGTVILILSTSETEEDIARAISLGAAGYISKSADMGDVISALRQAKAGTLELPDHIRRIVRTRANSSTLSERELQVLALVAKGFTNREIASILHFSVHNAKAHIARILEKMNVADRTEAATEAFRRGLLSDDLNF